MERFTKIVYDNFAKRSILDVWQGSEYAFDVRSQEFGSYTLLSHDNSETAL